jgi:AbiJ-like protein
MRFSQRKGYIQVSHIIQTENMNTELRNSIWNILEIFVWRQYQFHNANYQSDSPRAYAFILTFWLNFLKLPIGNDLYISSAFEEIE